MSEEKYGFNYISDMMKMIQDYPDHEIEKKLGNIHDRTNKIVQYRRIDESLMSDPHYFPIKTLRTMHLNAADEYTKYYPLNDTALKAGLLKKINTMDIRLGELEKGERQNEE